MCETSINSHHRFEWDEQGKKQFFLCVKMNKTNNNFLLHLTYLSYIMIFFFKNYSDLRVRCDSIRLHTLEQCANESFVSASTLTLFNGKIRTNIYKIFSRFLRNLSQSKWILTSWLLETQKRQNQIFVWCALWKIQ